MPFWWWWLGIKMKGCNFLFVFRCINIAVYVKTSQVNTKHIKKTPPNYFFPSCHYDYLWQNNSATQLDFYTRHFQSGTSSFLFSPSFVYPLSISMSFCFVRYCNLLRDYWIYCVENCYCYYAKPWLWLWWCGWVERVGLCSA